MARRNFCSSRRGGPTIVLGFERGTSVAAKASLQRRPGSWDADDYLLFLSFANLLDLQCSGRARSEDESASLDGSWEANRTSYWLLICGSFLVVGSVALTWLRFPYSFNIAGFELPVQALVPHIHEFSYGLIGIAVLAIALYYRKRFRWALLLGAAILLTDWMLVPARLTLHQPPLLRRLNEEAQAVQAIKAFPKSHLPQRNGGSEEMPKNPDLITLSGRFAASLPFSGLGWYCFGFGSFLVACYAVNRLPGERMASSLALPAGVLTILAIPSRSHLCFTYSLTLLVAIMSSAATKRE